MLRSLAIVSVKARGQGGAETMSRTFPTCCTKSGTPTWCSAPNPTLRAVPTEPPGTFLAALSCLPSVPGHLHNAHPAQEMDAVMQLQSQTPDPVPPDLPELPLILPETPVPEPEPEPGTDKPPILN